MLGGIVAFFVLLRPGRSPGPSSGSASSAASTTGASLRESDAQATLAAASPLRADARVPAAISCAHGDGRRTQRARGEGPRRDNLLFRVDAGGPVATQPIPSPDGSVVYVGTLTGDLVAVRMDGTLGWKTNLGDRVYSAPCVDKSGTLFLGSDAKRFYAVLPDGKVRWKLDVDDDADTAPLLRDDGSVVFAAGRDVIAVSATGTVLWRFQAKRKVFTAPAMHPDGFVVVGSQDNRVYAIDARGNQVWATELGADVDGGPVVADDGSIYVGTDGDEVVKLGPRGAILFRARVAGYVRGMLSLSRSGDVLAGVYGPAPRQVRLRETDGAVLGAFSVPGTGARDFGVHGGALEDDAGNLYFGAQDDRIYAVDRQGTLLWSHLTGGDVDAPPTLLPDGRLIVASDDGTVYCFGR